MPTSYKRNTAPLKRKSGIYPELNSLSLLSCSIIKACFAMYYLTITPRWVCVEYSTHIGTQNSNDDQSRGYVPGTMQLLCLPQRAKYTSSTRFLLLPAAWIAWDIQYCKCKWCLDASHKYIIWSRPARSPNRDTMKRGRHTKCR